MATSRPSLEADLLIRLSHVSLEQERPREALTQAKDGTLAALCSKEREMMGRGLATTGMLHYYTAHHASALRDARCALEHLRDPIRQVGAHQTAAFASLALERHQDAHTHLRAAWQCAREAPSWMQGKVTWLEARLSEQGQRETLLRRAKAAFSESPADRLLVTVELIKELLASDQTEKAAAEVPDLCILVEEAAESRQVQYAVSRLISRRSVLTEADVSKLRNALEHAHDRRLSYLIKTE